MAIRFSRSPARSLATLHNWPPFLWWRRSGRSPLCRPFPRLAIVIMASSASSSSASSASSSSYPAPGFVDLQVNGYLGVDFCSLSLTEAAFVRASRALLATGTVAFLPTVITASETEYAHVLPIIGRCAAMPEFRGRVLGIHLEGPFISPEPGAVGAHRPAHTRPADPAFLQRLIDLSGDTVRLVTIAAELEGAADLCRWCRSRPEREPGKAPIVVSLGHQLAGADQVAAVAAAGASMLTHLGNGMPNSVHRHHNPLLAGLAEPALVAGIIADGFHLPPHMLRVLLLCKGVGGLVAVSDMAPICGCAPGVYDCLGTRVVLEESFRVSEFGKDNLAGSGSTLTQCANVLRRVLQMELADIAEVAYNNPLRTLGLDPEKFTQQLVAGAAAVRGAARLVRAEFDPASDSFIVAAAASVAAAAAPGAKAPPASAE